MGLVLRGHVGDVAITEGTRDAAADVRREAFVRHLEASLDRSYALAAVILGDRAEAEEATHDAVCAAWRGIGGLKDYLAMPVVARDAVQLALQPMPARP